jgi:uncharacterized protein YggE
MRRRILALSFLTALTLAGCSALGLAPQRTLTVTGSGSTRISPDIVSVTLGIQTRHDDVGQAVAQNNTTASRIMDAARTIGVADADMRTIYFSVSSQPKYDEFGSPTGQVSYFVDNSLQVTLRDITKLSDLLQAGIDAGANSVYGVTFSVADTNAAEDEARQKAIADAQARATELAGVSGVTLGTIQSVSTTAYSPYPAATYAYGYGMGGGGGPPTEPGSLEITAQVTLIYSVK